MEHHESIVNSIEAKFGTTIANSDSWHNPMSVDVSNWYKERMNTVAFLTNVELSPADSHVS